MSRPSLDETAAGRAMQDHLIGRPCAAGCHVWGGHDWEPLPERFNDTMPATWNDLPDPFRDEQVERRSEAKMLRDAIDYRAGWDDAVRQYGTGAFRQMVMEDARLWSDTEELLGTPRSEGDDTPPERPDIDVKRLAQAIVVWALQDATYSRPWVKRIKRHALADAHKIAAAYAAVR